MSQPDADTPLDPRAGALLEAFGRLAAADQDLVLALVHRLVSDAGAAGMADGGGYPPDVAFMDFEE